MFIEAFHTVDNVFLWEMFNYIKYIYFLRLSTNMFIKPFRTVDNLKYI